MKNFILRYLISYIISALLHYIFIYLDSPESLSAFKMILFWFLIPTNIVSSLIYYILIAYLKSNLKKVLIFVMLLSLIAIYIYVPNVLDNNQNKFGNYFLFCLLSIPQLLIPNFHCKEHPLDNKLNLMKSICLIFMLFAIIIYYLFFFDGFNMTL